MGLFCRGRKVSEEGNRTLTIGRGNTSGTDNSVRTAKYTLWSFLPKALKEQFRRNANIYFLGIGVIMFLGTYTPLFQTSVSPWTTLGPLAVVVAISLTQEGFADLARHKSDVRTNTHPCVALRRSEQVQAPRKRHEEILHGNDVEVRMPDESLIHVAFESVPRQDIYAGDIVLVRNREMIPVDLVLLASSGEQGCAYIETSPIDGETNLKLRKTPHPPTTSSSSSTSGVSTDSHAIPKHETLEHAVKRISRLSVLGYPHGVSAISGAEGPKETHHEPSTEVAALMAEAPNASVNTFSGTLTLPPRHNEKDCVSVSLEAENMLLRGAMLRNIDWVVGVAVYTGNDTKLVRNSIRTPSKFSRLDVLMNQLVLLILIVNIINCLVLAALSSWKHQSQFDNLWYLGYETNPTMQWPYFPSNIGAPKWEAKPPKYYQSVLTYLTLTSNFVPLSLYVTIEIITLFMMRLIGWDKAMYHKDTDTPAVARSTIVTDLGLCKYVFTDKTGTLTQNIMKFMRCSVDGTVFGAPIAKSSPLNENGAQRLEDENAYSNDYCYLNDLLVARKLGVAVRSSSNKRLADASVSKAKVNADAGRTEGNKYHLTFNAEMFLRVMSICHSVVVEREHEGPMIQETKEIKQSKGLFGKLGKKVSSSSVSDDTSNRDSQKATKGNEKDTTAAVNKAATSKKSIDGSPGGFVYQAESPDEGALVAAASNIFGFQFVTRESDGVKLSCTSRSILSEQRVIEGIKSNSLTAKQLAHETGSISVYGSNNSSADVEVVSHVESWSVLAVNKFDSDRKRMSVLVRTPPELGSIPMLFCKGADATMLKPGICEGSRNIIQVDGENACSNAIDQIEVSAPNSISVVGKAADDSETADMLGLQAHLGEFASEGLRTLVLGVKFVTESQCQSWLASYKEAATAMKDRSMLLRKAADEIETNLHIVGATAIEDKLQDGVPDAIRHLGDSGIKLWVLTGDKKETAIEIGYATKVLTPKMIVTEVGEGSDLKTKALIAMEFIRLVKAGSLPLYQRSALTATPSLWKNKRKLVETRQKVRDLAESILRAYLQTPEGQAEMRKNAARGQKVDIVDSERDDLDDISTGSDSVPRVFAAAQIARQSMKKQSVQSNQVQIKDDDILSLVSVELGDAFDGLFDKKKRTLFEQLFSVDKDVRHGHLVKHLAHRNNLSSEPNGTSGNEAISAKGLVIEGGALAHLLGDPLLEQMLFAVASKCDSVIACRVTPKQKALVVKLARTYDGSNPVTLAIGDGANDVGMIQEAQIGVGISGLEGQQAVNASDFAIAQFRFLEELLLIHGRWNFMRMSKVVLFSFYKNAVLVALLVCYSAINLYSGTTLFDQWVTAAFNFVCGIPIIFLGCFDRDLEKDYVKKQSIVYMAGPNNEHLSARVSLRWAGLVLAHTTVIYSICASSLLHGGGMSSAFRGFMLGANENYPGDGEGDNWKVYGTTIILVLIFMLAYKVLYECRSLIHGVWPAFTCKKGVGEGFYSRVAWTWVGVTWGSIIFTIVAMYLYALVGRLGASSFSDFVDVAMHVFQRRLMTWMLILLVPTAAIVLDVCGKVYSNFYYPSQTQIHIEIQAQERREKSLQKQASARRDNFGEDAV